MKTVDIRYFYWLSLCILLMHVTFIVPAYAENVTVSAAANGHGKTLFINGRIDENVERSFKYLFTDDVAEIIVNSAGGEGLIAIKMANVISRRRIKITVRGNCISACSYLFLASQNKIIEKGSVFGIHGTFNAMDFEKIRPELEMGYRQSEKDEKKISAMIELAKLSFNKVRDDGMREQSTLAKTMGFDERIFAVTAETDFPPKLREGVQSVIWWPSARKLHNCFKVRNVTDYARPADDDMDTYVDSKGYSSKKLQLIGDNVKFDCKG